MNSHAIYIYKWIHRRTMRERFATWSLPYTRILYTWWPCTACMIVNTHIYSYNIHVCTLAKQARQSEAHKTYGTLTTDRESSSTQRLPLSLSLSVSLLLVLSVCGAFNGEWEILNLQLLYSHIHTYTYTALIHTAHRHIVHDNNNKWCVFGRFSQTLCSVEYWLSQSVTFETQRMPDGFLRDGTFFHSKNHERFYSFTRLKYFFFFFGFSLSFLWNWK